MFHRISTVFLFFVLSACGDGRGCSCRGQNDSEDVLLRSDPAALVALDAADVLAELGIASRCDSLVVEVTLEGGQESGCDVQDLTAWVAWYSDPALEFGARVVTEVYFAETEVCGHPVGGTGAGDATAFDGEWYLSPEDDTAQGDALTMRLVAASMEADDSAGIGIIADVATQNVLDGGALYELYADDGQADEPWPGYDRARLTGVRGEGRAPANANIPGCD